LTALQSKPQEDFWGFAMTKFTSFASSSQPNRRRLIATGAAIGAAGIGAGWWLAQPPKLQTRHVPQLPAGRAAGAGAGKGLNILLVMTDQERFDLPNALPLPGHERLRERGGTFTQHQVNTTPCSPSRSNLYFGQHPQHTRMTVNLGVYPEPQIPAAMPSLGHYLRANGYYTAYKGIWHLSELRAHYELTYGRYPSAVDALEPFGFSDFNFDGDPHGSTWTGFKFDGQIASEASTWLQTKGKSLGAEKPWFLAVNFVNPHDVMYYASGNDQIKSRVHRDYLSVGHSTHQQALRQALGSAPAGQSQSQSRRQALGACELQRILQFRLWPSSRHRGGLARLPKLLFQLSARCR
jgi:hypothetical protein